MDVFWQLAEDDVVIRQRALVSLIEGIEAQQFKDQKDAIEAGIEVKLTSDGLDKSLQYALQRLIKGLASSRQSARQGFAAALTHLILKFTIPTSAIVSVATTFLNPPVNAAPTEKREYDIAFAFLLIILGRTDKISEVSNDVLIKRLSYLFALLKSNPQVAEICSETLFHLASSLSEVQIETCFLPIVFEKLKMSFDTMTPYDLNIALALRRVYLNYPAIFEKEDIKSKFPSYIPNLFAPSLHASIFNVASQSTSIYPIMHSIWNNLLNDMTLETVINKNNTTHSDEPQHVPANMSSFLTFWSDYVATLLATRTDTPSQGLLLHLLLSAIQHYQNLSTQIEDSEVRSAWLIQQLVVLFQPQVTGLFIRSLRPNNTAQRAIAQSISKVLLSMGTEDSAIALGVISMLSNTSRGGARYFDVKTNSNLIRSLQNTLSLDSTRNYLTSLIATFKKASETAVQDVRVAAQATVDKERAMKDELENVKEEDSQVKEEEYAAFTASSIGDVDEFMKTDVALQAIAKAEDTLREWAVEQITEICKNTRLIAVSQEKKVGVDKSQSEQVDERIETCLFFLFRQAFFSAPTKQAGLKPSTPKKGKKAAKAVDTDFVSNNDVVVVSEKVRRSCVSNFISILTALLDNALTETRNGSKGAVTGSLWVDRVFEYWNQLEENNFAVNIDEEFNEGSRMAHAVAKQCLATIKQVITVNTPTEKKPFVNEDPRRVQLTRARVLNLFVSHLAVLQLTDQVDFSPVLLDLNQIVERIFGQEDEEDEDEDTQWIEVLVDVILSLLIKPSALLRVLCNQVFTSFLSDLTHVAVSDIMRVLVNVEEDMGTEGQADEDDDEDDEDDEDEEEEEEKEEQPKSKKSEIDSNVLTVSKSKHWDPLSAQIEEEEAQEEDEELDFGAALRGEDDENEDNQKISMGNLADMLMHPAFMSSLDGFQTAEDKALQELVKMKKARNARNTTLKLEAVNFKLRVLDLVEILLKTQNKSALALGVYEPLALAVLENSNKPELASLHDRLSAIYCKKLCVQYTVSVTPVLPTFITNTEAISATPITRTNEDLEITLSAPQPEANLVLATLNKCVESMYKAKLHEGRYLYSLAFARLANQYLSVAADHEEWNATLAKVAPSAAPATKSKASKSKKASTDVVDKVAMLTEIRKSRLSTLESITLGLLTSYLRDKRSNINHRTFETIINKSPSVMWTKSVLNFLNDSITTGISVFLCKEAVEFVGLLMSSKKLQTTEEAYKHIKKFHDTLAIVQTQGAIALKSSKEEPQEVKEDIDLTKLKRKERRALAKKSVSKVSGSMKCSGEFVKEAEKVYFQISTIINDLEKKLNLPTTTILAKRIVIDQKKVAREKKKAIQERQRAESLLKNQEKAAQKALEGNTDATPVETTDKKNKKKKAPVKDNIAVEEKKAKKAKK